MKVGYANAKQGSDSIRRALAAARSARNQSTRQGREQDRDSAVAACRQRRRVAKEDRDWARAANRRIRVQVADGDRPRTGGRTPRSLFTRQAAIFGGSTTSRIGGHRDGMRSIHFSFVARGFESTSGRRWRSGEAGRAGLYIVREEALEGGEAGWWSNIAEDRRELLAFWRTAEVVERHDRKNANVYVMEIIALDASLAEAERRLVVTTLCGDLERRGLAYAVGMHKPDRSGDQRNYHVHLMYSLRPAERHGAYDWSFAVSKVADLNTPDGIRARRACAVDSMNVVLTLAGSDRRYTMLSNKARGISDSPQPKLGKKAVWVARRLFAWEQRADRLDLLRAGVLSLQASLSVIDRITRVQTAIRDRLARTSERAVEPRPETVTRIGAIGEGVRRRLEKLLGDGAVDLGLEQRLDDLRNRETRRRRAAILNAQARRLQVEVLLDNLSQNTRDLLEKAKRWVETSADDVSKRRQELRDVIAGRIDVLPATHEDEFAQRLDAIQRQSAARLAVLNMTKPASVKKAMAPALAAALAARGKAAHDHVHQEGDDKDKAPIIAETSTPPANDVSSRASVQAMVSDDSVVEARTGDDTKSAGEARNIEDSGLMQLALIARLFHGANWDRREYDNAKHATRSASREAEAARDGQSADSDADAAAWYQISKGKLEILRGSGR